MCVFSEDVPQGGLTLGEIRQLAYELIHSCNKCSRITANYFSKNETQLDWLKFDWKGNSVCTGDCIDPAIDLVLATITTTATTATATATKTLPSTNKLASGTPTSDQGFVSPPL